MKGKVRKTLLVIMTSAVLVFTGCGNQDDGGTTSEGTTSEETGSVVQEDGENQETLTEPTIVDGYYYDDSIGLGCFYKFYEDGTYYASFFDGGVVDAGIYEVVEEELEFFVDAGADEDFATVEDNTVATAPQVVVVTSYSSGTPVKIALQEDILCDTSFGGMVEHGNLTHVADYTYIPSVEEKPIRLYLFYANGSAGSTFSLSHDRTFIDVTGDVIQEGTWEMTGTGEFALDYDESDEASTLTVDASGKSANLAKPSGEELPLSDSLLDVGDIILTLGATDQQVGLPMGVDVNVECYADGTCAAFIYVAMMDMNIELDKGTYSFDAAYQLFFQFENAGEIMGVPNYDTASDAGLEFDLNYVYEGVLSSDGTDTPISVNSELNGLLGN